MSITAEITASDRGDQASARVLRAQLDAIRENFDGAIAGDDPERLHDLRVAVRRTRTVQRQLHTAFRAEPLAHFRREYRWLQRVTGDARDLDVHVHGFGELRQFVPEGSRSALEPVLELLRRRRVAARAEMERTLRSPRCAVLLEQWDGFLVEAQAAEGLGVPAIGELVDVRIGRLFAGISKMGAAIEASTPPEDYHELRKQGKELRYMLELFAAPLQSAERVKSMIKLLKSLQNTLGRHQDREVQIATLYSLRDAVRLREGSGASIAAVDELIDALYADERAARDQYRERFEAFVALRLPAGFEHTSG